MLGLADDAASAGSDLWRSLIPTDERERVDTEFARLLESAAQTYEIEFSMRHASGRRLRVLSRGFIQRDAAGVAVRVSGTNTDVTERLELEGRQRQSQKLEAIGQLAGGVAHDFNNVLAVVLGNLDLVRSEIPADSQVAVALDDALAAAQRGAELTRRLLAFGRQQPLSQSAVDVARALHGLHSMLARLLGETIQLEVAPDDGLPPIWTDAHQLESVIVNLGINARDAMPSGGRLRIAATLVTLDADSAARIGLAAGRYVRLDVVDSGEGMSADVMARALDPFFSTKAPGDGTGLGLSMAYGFARQSGGTLVLDSTLGAGTTVHVFLPVADRAVPAEPLPSRPPRRPAVARPERILVVEDEDSVRRLCVRTLLSLGFEVVEAPDGPTALERLDGMERVDLLLSDVVMPKGMSGRELAERARARHPRLRVLHMSGYPAKVFDDLAPEDRDRLLRKPFTVAALSRAIEEVLDAPT
jgi:PAS domain S-box-containing protein